ncbi:MAG TPA: hypothetical protein PLN07_10415 [Myxococcota bacterium]|nr:hypothetical protein [Myxococcota bacterium]
MKFKLAVAVGIVALAVTMAVCVFAYRNLNFDYLNASFLEESGYKLGFTEDMARLEGGLEIYYIEGPNNGPKLLLLHGVPQPVSRTQVCSHAAS